MLYFVFCNELDKIRSCGIVEVHDNTHFTRYEEDLCIQFENNSDKTKVILVYSFEIKDLRKESM